jgi:class 3 adenylate cyclase
VASRLEGLCGKLSRRTVTSAAFARLASSGLASLGTFDLKGIGAPEEAFGLEELP